MNFVEIIKRQLMDERYRRGAVRGQTLVDTRALIELIESFERLESEQRTLHTSKNVQLEPARALSQALGHAYRTLGDEGELFLFIMDVLKPLIKERRELERVKNAERGHRKKYKASPVNEIHSGPFLKSTLNNAQAQRNLLTDDEGKPYIDPMHPERGAHK